MACAGAVAAGADIEAVLGAVARFPGVARRMEIVGEASGVVVVDDFAHHPTALAATISAARQLWPDRRLVVAYEPRSLSAARYEFQRATEDALGGADLVLVAPVFHRDRLAAGEAMDRSELQSTLAGRGIRALIPEVDDDPVAVLLPELEAGDVVIGCSSGSFGDLHRRLLAELADVTRAPTHP
jgi:UDP-N-acetylmuramate: L-alanyl-gamma-D-glutamyl-meso-diaminopimelate ligase